MDPGPSGGGGGGGEAGGEGGEGGAGGGGELGGGGEEGGIHSFDPHGTWFHPGGPKSHWQKEVCESERSDDDQTGSVPQYATRFPSVWKQNELVAHLIRSRSVLVALTGAPSLP